MFGGLSLGGAVGGVLGFIGQQQTNQKNWDIAQAANAASAEQARAQMNFQERMRETQYQTAVEDMKKAGLNPMLAYSQGGAGTPSGAMGQVSTAKVGNTLASAVQGYQSMAMTNAELDQKDALTQNTSAATLKTEADTIQTAVNIQKILADTELSKQQYINMQEMLNKLIAEIAVLRVQKPFVQAQTEQAKATTVNVKENIAPSTDPYWYRDIKRAISRVRQNPSLLIPFGGSKK
jgi:hypothetical protein